jgi:hypothetical protein
MKREGLFVQDRLHSIRVAFQPLDAGFACQHAQKSEQGDDRWSRRPDGNEAVDHADRETDDE